jgi:hypothetical protein
MKELGIAVLCGVSALAQSQVLSQAFMREAMRAQE